MGELTATQIEISTALNSLEKREWLVPQFQRDFVWEIADVISLITSVFQSHPIGMITIWEQPEEALLELERLSIPDWNKEKNCRGVRFFGLEGKTPKYMSAILDGRQRCTALAMAFKGFRPKSGIYKYAGRYFLDVTAKEIYNEVIYKKDTELKKEKLTTEAACISRGLFPLASIGDDDTIMNQWYRYTQVIKDPTYYEPEDFPESDELERRNNILRRAFEGLTKTKIALYSVPDTYDLAEICEIFETLNMTGTAVSTVDLIHSWLYSDSYKKLGEAIQLRDWIAFLGEKEGAIGWAVVDKRPELIAQMVAACHVALEKKYPPRKMKGSKKTSITSVKSPDLLAVPAEHWADVIKGEEEFAQYIGDFQKVVADGYFPYSLCPYPISSAIYIALRWHHQQDDEATHPWKISDLNALYKAFFWRNSLSQRYDQGFLTQLGQDLIGLKRFLNERPDFSSSSDWANEIEPKLTGLIDKPIPTEDELIEKLTNGRPGGAFQSAIRLPALVGVKSDLISAADLTYPSGQAAEMHHIFPQKWCKDNKAGKLAKYLDIDISERDWVNSSANMMPMRRETNNEWSTKLPQAFLEEKNLAWEGSLKSLLAPAYFNEELFSLLLNGSNGIPKFWEKRAKLMAEKLISLTAISY